MNAQHTAYAMVIVMLGFCTNGLPQTRGTPTFGSIQGKVLDIGGNSIPGAKVFDLPMGVPLQGKDHYADTDSHGVFRLNAVSTGKVMVVATKEGYPDGRWAVFAGDDEPPIVEVHEGEVIDGLTIRLGPKGATILGKVTDEAAGMTVSSARINLLREDHPDWSEDTSVNIDGTFEFVVPQKPLRLSVTAPGYHPWVYQNCDKRAGSSTILLPPEKRLEIVVHLKKAAS